MPDNKSKRGARHRNRVAGGEAYEVNILPGSTPSLDQMPRRSSSRRVATVRRRTKSQRRPDKKEQRSPLVGSD
jgi:hypothetical protein